jgi:nicotinamide-nucleotide amidase
VAYQRDVKFELLGVTPGPVVSTRAGAEMAIGVAALLHADVTVAVTGAAGPDPHDGAPPGTVVIAVAVDGHTTTREYHFDGPPPAVAHGACARAVCDLADAVAAMSSA